MSKFVGKWVYDSTHGVGDTTKLLALDIRDESGSPFGTAVGLGWTPTFQVRYAGGTTLVATITGSWEDAAVCDKALFSIGAATALAPAAGDPPINYEGLIVLTSAGQSSISAADGNAEPFVFSVERWPS